MEAEAKFPTFKCFITNAQEDYDSGVWEFFRHYDAILSDLGQLKLDDDEWKENYIQLMRYYHDLGDSIIMKRNSPDSGFMTATCLGSSLFIFPLHLIFLPEFYPSVIYVIVEFLFLPHYWNGLCIFVGQKSLKSFISNFHSPWIGARLW